MVVNYDLWYRTQLGKVEKQVSKPLVVSCTLMQAHAFGYND